MARFGRGLALVCLGLSFLQPAILADGAASPGGLPVINGTVNSSQWEALPYDPTLRRCVSVDCRALKSILHSFDILGSFYLPNTMARTTPPPRQHGPIPIVSDVTRHPDLRRPSCKLLTVLAKNYFDWSVGLLTVELASLISRGHRQCLTEVISAFPQNKETRELVENAQEDCVVRHEPNCSTVSFK